MYGFIGRLKWIQGVAGSLWSGDEKFWYCLVHKIFKISAYKKTLSFNRQLVHTNKTTSACSNNFFIKTGKPIITIKANRNISKAKRLSLEDFGDLEPKVSFNIGSKVILTQNLWIKHGLCNGAIGFVKYIICKLG